ncbi:MAG: EAL domain-containing protein [Chloroflexi bacterium]|nr:EAL domain-containing protein [Chloroflexota bacterium]
MEEPEKTTESQPKSAAGRWKLRNRLIMPIVALVLAVATIVGTVGSMISGRQAEAMIARRANAALAGTLEHLQERLRTQEAHAQLLAEIAVVASAVERADRMQLREALVPPHAVLKPGQVAVFGKAGAELLILGQADLGIASEPLVAQAVAGERQSALLAGRQGLVIMAAAPVRGSNGVVGAVLVGTAIAGDGLNDVMGIGAPGLQAGYGEVALAVSRDGSLITATPVQSDLARLLSTSRLTPEGVERLSWDLARHNFFPVASALPDGGMLLVLVPTEDLGNASREFTIITLIGDFVLVVVLLLAGLMLARDIAAPLEGMAGVAEGMVRGNYRRRVPATNIRELNDLGSAINHLAQQLEIQLAQLAHQAFHDPLSNLPNRALFLNRVEHALARANRHNKLVALLFLDLDNFKVVNDSLGHQMGDRMLVAVAERLKLCVRNEDTVARFGGDEFTVLLEGVAGLRDVIRVVERIEEQTQKPFVLDGHEVFATASIGIALSSREHDEPNVLLRDADLAMYRAKTSGKAHYEVFDPSLDAIAMERLQLETDLRRALERGELTVYYQPVVLLESGRIEEMEALVRWQHPRRGLLPPMEFIPLAEDTGLILPIGRWVLEQACRQAQMWNARYSTARLLAVSVNLSARQFQDPKLVEETARILHDTGLNPACLKLEITESVMMHDAESTLVTLVKLKELGLELTVDDFGTGYSSLAYLKRFPVDALKIDKTFVEKLGQDPRDSSIVRAVTAFGRALDLVVTGEGIETAEQLTKLRELGCARGQGYYFAKPLPGDQLDVLLASRMDQLGAPV